MSHDLELAFRMVDAADVVTAAAWSPDGVTASLKIDGSPVTEADVAAERAMLTVASRPPRWHLLRRTLPRRRDEFGWFARRYVQARRAWAANDEEHEHG